MISLAWLKGHFIEFKHATGAFPADSSRDIEPSGQMRTTDHEGFVLAPLTVHVESELDG
jgi:hypothetical protein